MYVNFKQAQGNILRVGETVEIVAGRAMRKAMATRFEEEWERLSVVVSGRYKSSIGHYDGGFMVFDRIDAGPWDALWKETPTTIWCGTQVPYAGQVEDNHMTMECALAELREQELAITKEVMMATMGWFQ